MLALEDVVGRVDLADVVHDARVAELLDQLRRQSEPRGDRLDIAADAQEMRPGVLVLERRGQQQMADALKPGAPQLLVGDALLFEGTLELGAALALRVEQLREI